MEKKALFLGVSTFKNKEKTKDFRTVNFYVPPYENKQGYKCGGSITVFTPTDSKLGDDIPLGTIVIPEYDYDGCSQRADLVGIKVVKQTPYKAEDFAGVN